MCKIGKIIHLTHVVKDLEAADRWFDEMVLDTADSFGMVVSFTDRAIPNESR